MNPRFIRKKFTVEDESRTATFQRGQFSGKAPQTFFLIGLRGSGKTTLGKELAARLELPFGDTDEMVEKRAGKTVAQIVEHSGWEEFRRLEHEVLAGLCAGSPRVIATGGGIVLLAENRELLRQCGKVLYLQAPLPVLTARLAADPVATQRPALSRLSLEEELSTMLQARDPLYMECADFILRTDRTLDAVISEAVELVRL
ncbi:MAG: shikimate kinase AroL [Desulfovibrionales bacterium]